MACCTAGRCRRGRRSGPAKAPCGGGRGPPAVLRQLRGRDPEGQLRRRPRRHLRPRHLAARRRCARGTGAGQAGFRAAGRAPARALASGAHPATRGQAAVVADEARGRICGRPGSRRPARRRHAATAGHRANGSGRPDTQRASDHRCCARMARADARHRFAVAAGGRRLAARVEVGRLSPHRQCRRPAGAAVYAQRTGLERQAAASGRGHRCTRPRPATGWRIDRAGRQGLQRFQRACSTR